MAQEMSGKGDVRTFIAQETLTANAAVRIVTTTADGPWITYLNTSTGMVIGLTLRGASATGEAVPVLLSAPVGKALANASISAGAIVGLATDAAGRVTERANPATVTTVMVPILGIALQSAGATGATFEVLLQPVSTRPAL